MISRGMPTTPVSRLKTNSNKLRGRVSTKGRFTRTWVLILKRLHITGYAVHPR